MTPSAVSLPTGGSLEDPDAAADNRTVVFPPGDLDQATGSGMTPIHFEEEKPSQKTPIGDPEELQPTAESEPQNKTLEPKGRETNLGSKKTQAGTSQTG